jgi:hypothetical protein
MLLGVGVGVAATVTMDVLGAVARRLGLVAGAKGTWVGRWYLGMARGRFVHANIAESPEQPGEQRAALVGHYVIGIVLAVVYVTGAGFIGVTPSSFWLAMGYGLATCVFPLFLVYPALGYGVFGWRAPAGMKPVTSSVLNHLFYGFGLWWSATLLQLG